MRKSIICKPIATLVCFLAILSMQAQESVEDNVQYFNEAKTTYHIKNVEAVNTKYSDFGVAYYGTSQVVYASSKNIKGMQTKIWKPNAQPYLELYVGDKNEKGDIQNSHLFSEHINTPYHEACVAFTKDLKTVYFTRSNYTNNVVRRDSVGTQKLKLYKAKVTKDGKWKNIEELNFNSDDYSVGHPTLNEKENRLYFISDMPGGFGQTDIYYINLTKKGYGKPINAGAEINTIGKEMFPFMGNNNKLYYSSNSMEGYGGLDVYSANVLEMEYRSVFSNVANMGSPINSSGDDFAYVEEGLSGYFSSNREGGKGDDDIYYFEKRTDILPVEEEKEEPAVVNTNCVQRVSGVVREEKSGALLPGSFVTLFKEDGEVLEKVIADRDAKFSFPLDCNATSYKLRGEKTKYLEDVEKFTTERKDMELTLNLDLHDPYIEKRSDGKYSIKVNPIYFDLDKDAIRPDAAKELNKVIEVMKRYPNMVVRLGSHTDSRADDDYNWELSNKRAKSSLEYIISRGIDSSRIFGSGYGETMLINGCSNEVKCDEQEHQQNRRTEFIIVRY